MRRVRELVIDGLLLALPLIVVVYLLAQVIQVLIKVFAPLSALAPQGRWLGVVAVDVAAVAFLIFALVALGRFARSWAGRSLSASVERTALRRVPGYLLVKSVATGFSSRSQEGALKPALIAFDDSVALGFVVEIGGVESSMVTVFMPSAPAPAVGNIALVTRGRVTLLDVPLSKAIQTVTCLGVGMQELVASRTRALSRSTDMKESNATQ